MVRLRALPARVPHVGDAADAVKIASRALLDDDVPVTEWPLGELHQRHDVDAVGGTT